MYINNIFELDSHAHGAKALQVINASIDDDPADDRPAFILAGSDEAMKNYLSVGSYSFCFYR